MTKYKKREKNNKNPKNNYRLWNNGRLFSIILIGVCIFLFILSIIEIPFLSAIPGYTFGFLFGYYSYGIYLFLIYFAACKLFNINIIIIKFISKFRVFNYSWINLALFLFGFMLIIETSIYINSGNSNFPGSNAWSQIFDTWWIKFTSFNNALKPNMNNYGILPGFSLAILYSIGGTIISIIFSILLIFYAVFYLFFSSPVKKFNMKRNKKEKLKKEDKEYEKKIIDLSFEDEHEIIVGDFGEKIISSDQKTKQTHPEINIPFVKEEVTSKEAKAEEEVKDDFDQDETVPFDNPFDDGDDFLMTTEIINKTKEDKEKNINNKNEEIIFDNLKNKENINPQTYKKTTTIKTKKNERR